MLEERIERDFYPPHPQFIALAFRDKESCEGEEGRGRGVRNVLSSRGKLEEGGGKKEEKGPIL